MQTTPSKILDDRRRHMALSVEQRDAMVTKRGVDEGGMSPKKI